MKESGKERLKSTIYESTLSTADAVPLPQWGRLRRCDASRRFFIKAMSESGGDSDMGKRISNIRGSQPRLATLDSPFQRKGRECGAF